MNIIEKIRSTLEQFPKISAVCNAIHVEFADSEPTSYGLSSIGDSLVSEDILGNQTRQHNFLLYSTFSGINDYERLANSSILLELAQWLELQIGTEVDATVNGKTRSGVVSKITTGNGLLYEVPAENTGIGFRYQLQIAVIYKIYKIYE